jgi:nucleoside-diphosphate-sugar epimerase
VPLGCVPGGVADMPKPYLVTGAQGCIGAWVVKTLVERGDRPFVLDLSTDRKRLAQVMGSADLERVRFLQGDITDQDTVSRALEQSGANRVIHLAGLQVPFCNANPSLGARVNVVGTIHVFEAARTCGAERVAYASSAAVYGPDPDGGEGTGPAVGEGVTPAPTTHYGVFKQANEGTARIYWQDGQVNSAGLRPLTVYGVTRDQGLTSDLTKAIKAAVVGREFMVRFSGATDVLYVRDAANAFIACADRSPAGAHVYNLHGQAVRIEQFLAALGEQVPAARELVRCSGKPLPIAATLDDGAFQSAVGPLPATPLADGIRETVALFRQLQRAGRLPVDDLAV